MKDFDWAVIGAGPAGLAVIGKLLDEGVRPSRIAWFDDSFKVGDLGKRWYRVNGNTHVRAFLDYLKGYKSFKYDKAPAFPINNFDVKQSCRLCHVVEALQWISDHFTQTVHAVPEKIVSLSLSGNYWNVCGAEHETAWCARNVVLATGAYPKKLNYDIPAIPLEVALNDEVLWQHEDLSNDTVAIMGSSHSAVVALQNIIACKPKKIINFYQSPMKYALYTDSFILFDNTGLKGQAATWAKEYIDGAKRPDYLERVHVEDDAMAGKLASCTRIVYTVGFNRNNDIQVEGFPRGLSYNETNGILAPGLFGVGIAYPNRVQDPLGNVEYNVGIWKFMQHIDRCFPFWRSYSA